MFILHIIPKRFLPLVELDLLKEINKRLKKVDIISTVLDTPERTTPLTPMVPRARSVDVLSPSLESSSNDNKFEQNYSSNNETNESKANLKINILKN